MTLDIENPMPPELIRFAAFVDYDKAESAVAVGFRIGAAKRSTAGDFERVRITGATIESATFTSADEMDLELYGEDAFTAATADGIAASRLLKSVISGKFSIDIFVVEPKGSEWTYEISSEPPAGVRLSFEDCLEKTMPGQALLRASPVRLGR